jgi:lipid-binding SYLF domain-containing protein
MSDKTLYRLAGTLMIAATLLLAACQSTGGNAFSGSSTTEINRDAGVAKNGRTVAYYNTVAASYGLQAGVQSFSYALFFMTDDALKYLDKSEGWEVGVGPSIVVVDAGAAKSLTTTTAKSDVYAFIFDQKGLMAGLGLQGSKITKINPK